MSDVLRVRASQLPHPVPQNRPTAQFRLRLFGVCQMRQHTHTPSGPPALAMPVPLEPEGSSLLPTSCLSRTYGACPSLDVRREGDDRGFSAIVTAFLTRLPYLQFRALPDPPRALIWGLPGVNTPSRWSMTEVMFCVYAIRQPDPLLRAFVRPSPDYSLGVLCR